MQKRLTTFAGTLAALIVCGSLWGQQPELITVIKSEDINTGFGKRILPLGDQNGDGYDDLIVFDLLEHGYYYLGTASADTVVSYALRFDRVVCRSNNVGDINGDGADDFTIPGTASARKKLNLYFGGAGLDTTRDMWFGTDSLYGVGFTAYSPDIDDDGTPELISLAVDAYSALLFKLTQPSDSMPYLSLPPVNLTPLDYYFFGQSPVVGDFNADGHSDVALGLMRPWFGGLSGEVHFYWGGATFDTIPDLILRRPGAYVLGVESFGGQILENVGDLNGDGFDDLFASAGMSYDDSLGFVFFTGPELDSIPDLIVPRPHTVVGRAGDINHDGFGDFILSNPLPFSGLGDVNVYYGGPDMDSLPDITYSADEMPGYQEEFGRDCSGVGDFNGDGLEDFAFSFKGSYNYGYVLIYSVTDVNSVDYEYEPTLPLQYTLSQNYPNPFNLTTTIEFGLPLRSEVTLRVYNVLGHLVTELVNDRLSAGSYRVEWDGRDGQGRVMGSGVYLYELKAGQCVESRKMILLK